MNMNQESTSLIKRQTVTSMCEAWRASKAKTTFAEGKGETEYFRFKCYHNGNLHLEFKRPDLVQKINAIVGGLTLKGAQEAA